MYRELYKLERKTVKRSRYISYLGSVETRNGKILK